MPTPAPRACASLPPRTGGAGARALMIAALAGCLAVSAQAAPPDSASSFGVPPSTVRAETLRVERSDSQASVAVAPRFEPAQDAGRGLRNYGWDALYVFTAPARMGWREVAILGGTLAVGGVLYANDGPIYDKIHAHLNRDVYGGVIEVGTAIEPLGFMGDTNPIYIGALVLGYALQNGIGARIPGVDFVTTVSAEMLQSHLTAGAFRQVGEIFVGRERPFETRDPYVFEDGTSFPSGHASVISEFAVITSHHVKHPVYTVLAYSAAAAVCLQRIDAGTHWASDTWVGMAYGTYVARTLARRNDERRARDRGLTGEASSAMPGPSFRIEPRFDGGTRAFGLAIHARF